SIWMSSVLSSWPVILRALLITDTRGAPVVSVDDDDVDASTLEITGADWGRLGSITVGAGGGGGGTSTLSRAGVTAAPLASGLSLRVNIVMVGSPEVGRTIQRS